MPEIAAQIGNLILRAAHRWPNRLTQGDDVNSSSEEKAPEAPPKLRTAAGQKIEHASQPSGR
jgi:hypothetical protein